MLIVAVVVLVVAVLVLALVAYKQDYRIQTLISERDIKTRIIEELREQVAVQKDTIHSLEAILAQSEERMQEYDEAFQECQRLCEMLQEAKKLI